MTLFRNSKTNFISKPIKLFCPIISRLLARCVNEICKTQHCNRERPSKDRPPGVSPGLPMTFHGLATGASLITCSVTNERLRPGRPAGNQRPGPRSWPYQPDAPARGPAESRAGLGQSPLGHPKGRDGGRRPSTAHRVSVSGLLGPGIDADARNRSILGTVSTRRSPKREPHCKGDGQRVMEFESSPITVDRTFVKLRRTRSCWFVRTWVMGNQPLPFFAVVR
jgi:hypothetical protein